MSKGILLVGELNPYGSRPEYALWDEPVGATGDRLRRILGFSREDYRALARTNLCSGKWSAPEARRRASMMIMDWYSARSRTIVMLGRRVGAAFCGAVREHLGDKISIAPFESREVRAIGSSGKFCLVSIPHPSGRCRAWDDPAAIVRTRVLLEEAAPGTYSCVVTGILAEGRWFCNTHGFSFEGAPGDEPPARCGLAVDSLFVRR